MLQVITQTMAAWIIPMFLFVALVYAVIKKVDVFDTFVEGAKDGFATSVKLIPFLVAMLVAIGLLRASGALDLFIDLLTPLLARFNIPGEVVPLAIMRPLSGSGALGITAEIFNSHGPDSFVGRIASTMQGSTDTTLFVLTVYFGSVGIRRTRHALAVGLLADFTGFIAAIIVCTMVFG
ncbi:spore maturation protein [Dethiobacter alkaliphilus]|uniref:Nucleoside recognition domain protein n=1 Tax=Dethiobacter alkaliphilus AHT 1 TaxID=555088 RepID=C0GDY4_DETAL|nr:spore maturation protein [Dethiobacter alkaliphilus]EEG78278.1 nucleoside recognition domain protein [Dethiobacter alkaliphilus AHT 1]